jgi:hypothetical protein
MCMSIQEWQMMNTSCHVIIGRCHLPYIYLYIPVKFILCLCLFIKSIIFFIMQENNVFYTLLSYI